MTRRSTLRRRPGVLTIAAALALACSCGIPSADLGPTEYSLDLAEDIPMTGSPSDAFAEVDLVMRQYMKWRCVGAGTLAIAYKGRRVYKRGFGRMHGRASETLYEGCGDDESNPFDPDAPLVQPDTPMLIGSLSKAVTAAVARWLIQERMEERDVELPACDGPLCACDEPPCPATAADVPLLHPEMELLPEHLATLLRGDTPLPVPLNEDEPCVKDHDPAFADPRWRDVTVGNLISHQSGLRRSTANWLGGDDDVISHLATLRGYAPGDAQAWAAEHADLKQRYPEFATQIDAAAAYVSILSGGAPVYFVNNHNALAGFRPIDEPLTLSAGYCLEFNPGTKNYYSHSSGGPYDPIDRYGAYSNSAITWLGRVIDHVQAERRGSTYAANQGDPQSHWDSALEEYFTDQLGIDGGVESPEGIYSHQRSSAHRAPRDQPTPRVWFRDDFYSEVAAQHRPFCVMQGGECSFDVWDAGRIEDAIVRPSWDFSKNEDPALGFAKVTYWKHEHALGVAAGGLAVEAPVYLAFARHHGISGSSYEVDNGNGAEREEGVAGSHNGALAGGFANVLQLRAKNELMYLPPLVEGHLADDFYNLEQTRVEFPDGIDFIVAVNQRDDPRCQDDLWEGAGGCSSEYSRLSHLIQFGLSRVDWEAVEAELAAEAETVVGLAVDPLGRAHYWYADDMHVESAGDPAAYAGRVDGVGGKSAGPALNRYDLPSTRIGTDVVAVAMDAQGRVFTWYTDGRVSAGTPRALAAYLAPVRFETAPERDAYDIVGVAIASDGTVHTWYRDGSRSAGSTTALAGLEDAGFAPADGYAPEDIAAIAIERGGGPDGLDKVWTVYRDGVVSQGTIDDLAAYD